MRKTTTHRREKKRGGTAARDTATYDQIEGSGRAPSTPRRPNPGMPHERDESAHATGNRLREQHPPSKRQIDNAVEDLAEGRVDTDRRGIPNDIPTGGDKPVE